jgi:hypothetical protein
MIQSIVMLSDTFRIEVQNHVGGEDVKQLVNAAVPSSQFTFGASSRRGPDFTTYALL